MSEAKKIFGLVVTGAACYAAGGFPVFNAALFKAVTLGMAPEIAGDLISKVDYNKLFGRTNDPEKINRYLDKLILPASIRAIRIVKEGYTNRIKKQYFGFWRFNAKARSRIQLISAVFDEMLRDWKSWNKYEMIDKARLNDSAPLIKEMSEYILTVSSAQRDSDEWETLSGYLQEHLPKYFDIAFKEALVDVKNETAFKSYQIELMTGLREQLDGQQQSLDSISAGIRGIQESIDRSTVSGSLDELPRDLNNIPRHFGKFIGRDDETKLLMGNLGSSRAIISLNGIGGIGKTSLIKKLIANIRADYDHLIWISVPVSDEIENNTSTVDAIVSDKVLLKNLKVSFANETTFERFQYICNVLNRIKGSNLLIIDNAKEDLGDNNVRSILPDLPHWRILITSRNQLPEIYTVELNGLKPSEAKKLFQTHYLRQADETEIDELLKELGFHTLTIELLAKTLNFPGNATSIGDAIRIFKTKKLSSPHLQRKISLAHSAKETELYVHLIQTFDLSVLDDYEKWLLKAFYFLLPRRYEIAELEQLFRISGEKDQYRFHNGVQALVKKGWLSDGEYTMHRIIQQMVFYQLNPKLSDIVDLIDETNAGFTFDEGSDFSEFLPLISQAEFLLNQVAEDEQNSFQLLDLKDNLGIAFAQLVSNKKAKKYLSDVLNANLTRYGTDHPLIAQNKLHLAKAETHSGNFAEARTLLEQAFAIQHANYGENHSGINAIRSDLGIVLLQLGEIENAKDLLETALEKSESFYDDRHPEINSILANLAAVYESQGQFEKAKDYTERALKSDIANFGEMHPRVTPKLSNLAMIHKRLGDFNEAINLMKKVLNADINNFGDASDHVAKDLSFLGSLYRDSGDYELAKDFLLRAIQIDLANRHFEVYDKKSSLAELYKRTGDYESAKQMYLDALQGYMNLYPKDHSKIAVAKANLGRVWGDLGNFEKAEELLMQAVVSLEKSEDFTDYDTVRSNLALLYSRFEKFNEAIDLYEQLLPDLSNRPEPDNLKIGFAYTNFGAAFRKTGKLDKAKEYLEKGLSLTEPKLGQENVDVAMQKWSLGLGYMDLRNFESAEKLLAEAYLTLSAKLGKSHRDTIKLAVNIENLKKDKQLPIL